jgi:hypothetical protein
VLHADAIAAAAIKAWKNSNPDFAARRSGKSWISIHQRRGRRRYE